MMNVKDEDVDLGSTKFSIQTKMLSTTSGAGVNADSLLNMAFTTSDSLSELVWSPRTGLSLKRATSRAADTKPFLLWNVGPRNPEQSIKLNPTGVADHMIIDRATLLNASEREAELSKEEVVLSEESNAGSMICLHQEKGKGKALSDRSSYGTSLSSPSDDEVAKSSNSVGLSLNDKRGVKRWIYDKNVILGTKRMKMEIHSSFMKWISNMTKGLSDCGREDSFAPLTIACSNMGFQTIFQSLCCKEADVLNAGEKIALSIEESDKRVVDDTKSPENLPTIAEEASDEQDGLIPSHALGKETYLEKDNPRTSLWIARLATKPSRSEKGKVIAKEATGCSSSSPKDEFVESNASTNKSRNFIIKSEASFEVKSTSKLRSEAMVSVLARRLDALRHITLSRKGKFPTYHTWKFEISSSERSPRRGLDDNHCSPLCDRVAKSEVFDEIRSLRLSRADILKWMNYDAPLSRLNGFFLRLRLGKLEGVDGGGSSSYYVAYITGDAGENDRCTSSKSILVEVGGIKSFVASQYISNHDFLEDEMEAWWCRTVNSGCRNSSLAR